MSCDHHLVEQYLTDYLDSSLEPANARAIESAIDKCPDCREVYENALTLRQWESQWHEQPVPDWHRTRYAVAKPRAAKVSWFNWTTMATSALALAMVIFRVEIVTNDQGLMISFSGKGTQAQVAELVEQRVNQIAEQQINYIENRFDEFTLQQASFNQQLADSVVLKTRDERLRDMNTLMMSWMQQRQSDKEKLNQRVDYILENQIENNRYLNQVLKVADNGL